MVATEIQARDDEPGGDTGSEPGGGAGGAAAPARPRWRALLGTRAAHVGRAARPQALELLALTAFVFARPAFGSFGRSPESLVARGADWTDVIVFALVIVLGPVAALLAAEAVVGMVAGRRALAVVHLAVVGGLLATATWQLALPVVDWPRRRLFVLAVVVGLLLAAARARIRSLATFLRYASVGGMVFLVQFLVLSPTASIVLGGRHAPVADVAVPPDAAPVVLVVLDGLPTEMLLDGEGHIDAELYPNLARLAGDATWYRNHTTVAQITLEAVPAILSGSRPSADSKPPMASNYPDNIFTMLGDSHELHGGEAFTGLCPVSLCPEPAGSPLGGLLRDVGRIWELQMSGDQIDPELVPYVFEGRYPRAAEWIESQDFGRGERPGLHVLHLLVPHPGWEYLPDGSAYRSSGGRPQGLWVDTWAAWGNDVGRQRHVLQAQAADRLVGELLDRLRAAGTYDDSLVAVTADHGYAFTTDSPWRALDENNYDEIMWTPLIIKAPDQRRPVIDDRNVNSTDILPTIAAELGVDDLPDDITGEPAGSVERDPRDKWVVDWDWARLHPDGDDEVVHVDGVEGFERVLAADAVEGTGPMAVWRRTEYGHLVGKAIDDRGVEVGDPAGMAAAIDGLHTWDAVDADLPPLELTGQAPLPEGSSVAVTVDGVVGAVVPATVTGYGVAIIHALLWPDVLHDGANQIGVYVIDGPTDAPVLHPLDVVPK